MSFIDIDETYPRGTQTVSVLDDYARETRKLIKLALKQISDFPNTVITYLATWSGTSNRPNVMQDGMFGYNSEDDKFERYSGGEWEQIPLSVEKADLATRAQKDASGNTITSTYATNANLALKANIASPTLTGTPKAPTAAVGTRTTQIATTAFVSTAVSNASGAKNNGGMVNSSIVATAGSDSDGWCQFANGLVFEWGRSTSLSTTFPKAVTTVFQVMCTYDGTSGESDYNYDQRAVNITTRGFKIYRNWYPYRWFMIGYLRVS